MTNRATNVVAVSVGEVTGQADLPALPTPSSELGLPVGWLRGVARLGQRQLLIIDTNALVAS